MKESLYGNGFLEFVASLSEVVKCSGISPAVATGNGLWVPTSNVGSPFSYEVNANA